MAENMYNIGKIVNTHGVRGEVRVIRISDFEERFADGKTVYAVRDGREPVQLIIDGHRIHKNFDLLHFKGYDNINDVEQFKNAYLKITEKQLTDLEENEYYYHEIIGCDVFTVDGDYIGIIKEILAPGANDVWVVKREQEKDALIPYIEQVVISIDVSAKKVIIDPMEGLLE